MPCNSGMGDSGSSYDYKAREVADRAARAACDIFKLVEAMGADMSKLPDETRQWWAEHKAVDAAREAVKAAAAERETLKAQGYAKLTPEERAALNIRKP